MNSRKLKIVSLVLIALIAGIIWWFLNNRASEKEFKDLFAKAGSSHIAAITFSGQQQSIKVTDPEVLSAIEYSFRNGPRQDFKNGLSYEVSIKFETGHTLTTYLRTHDDNGGIEIADMTDVHVGDPRMIAVRFVAPVNARILALMDLLTIPGRAEREARAKQKEATQSQRP